MRVMLRCANPRCGVVRGACKDMLPKVACTHCGGRLFQLMDPEALQVSNSVAMTGPQILMKLFGGALGHSGRGGCCK